MTSGRWLISWRRSLWTTATSSPRVLHRVRHRLLPVHRHLHRDVDRAVVLLFPLVAALGDLPVDPPEEVLLHDHLHRLLLVIPQLDLEVFGHPARLGVHLEVRLLALADDIERAA